MTATLKTLTALTGIKPQTKGDAEGVLRYIIGIANDINKIDPRLIEAARAITFVMQTGRISATTEMGILAKTPYQTIKLLTAIAAECETMHEATYWLDRNSKQLGKAA